MIGRGDEDKEAEDVRPVLVITGPTASGKSGLALRLAEAADGVVINADAMQLYAAAPVLTAQPDQLARDRVPHALYGMLDPLDATSAERWRAMAIDAIRACAPSCLPILAGGTGLYLKALIEGLAAIPPVPPEIRARAEARRQALGAEAFHAELAARDPVWAARIRANDTQRSIRGWEVVEATGVALSSWIAAPRTGPPPGMRFHIVALLPERARLYAAIDARFRTMIDAGALAEARLLAQLPRSAPARKALGARELIAHLAGETDLETAIAAAQQATRNYAKRQVTWLRHQLPSGARRFEKLSCVNEDEIFSIVNETR